MSGILELDALITEVHNSYGDTDWRTAHSASQCPKRCHSLMSALLPIPFGKERARRRAHRHAFINLALAILREATARSAQEAVCTIESRLALYVLRRYVRDQALLAAFWRAAAVKVGHPWTCC